MRKHRHPEARAIITLRLWTYVQAVNALLYLRSIVGSLREHCLESQRARLQLGRLDARPGRPDRQALLLQAEALREAELAEERFEDSLNELMALNVYCLDPVRGLALIPFQEGDELAWFVFDLFAPQGLEAWRFHADSLETRRPLASRDLALVDANFSAGKV